MPLVSIRAYAKHRGVSLHAVQKAIRSRRMEIANGRIDVERADSDWERNTRARRPRSQQLTYSTPLDVDPTGRERDNYLAALARIEYHERIGRLVRVSEIEERLASVPDRVLMMLAGETNPDKMREILTMEIPAALTMAAVAREEVE